MAGAEADLLSRWGRARAGYGLWSACRVGCRAAEHWAGGWIRCRAAGRTHMGARGGSWGFARSDFSIVT